MSAELSYNDQGVAEVFSVRETPWHREGVVLAEAPTFDEALRIAGLDFRVEKRQLWTKQGDQFVESDLSWGTYRVDRDVQLGSVGKDYTVCQNIDAFAVLTPLLDQGIATIETGGALRAGADCWLQVKLALPAGSYAEEQFKALAVEPYAYIGNNHSGRRGVLAAITPIRIVCANTLGFAESTNLHRQIIVRHTSDVEAKLTEAAMVLFGDLITRFEAAAAQYRALKRTFLDLAQFRTFVESPIAPDPRENPRWNPEARMASAVVQRYEQKADRLRYLWEHGTGHVGDHSAWEAYNGAAEALDHDTELWPTRGGVYRTASLMDGVIAQRKQTVLDNLLGLAWDQGAVTDETDLVPVRR